jgi:chromosome segregation ATPase
VLEKPPEEKPREKKSDDGVPMFWRMCSAATLSITALVLVTGYNQLTSTTGSLRQEITALRSQLDALKNDASNNLVKKEDFNQRLLATAALIEKAQASTKASLEAWKERNQEQERSLRSALADLKKELRDAQIENQQLRERLASVETREGSAGSDRPKK